MKLLLPRTGFRSLCVKCAEQEGRSPRLQSIDIAFMLKRRGLLVAGVAARGVVLRQQRRGLASAGPVGYGSGVRRALLRLRILAIGPISVGLVCSE